MIPIVDKTQTSTIREIKDDQWITQRKWITQRDVNKIHHMVMNGKWMKTLTQNNGQNRFSSQIPNTGVLMTLAHKT